MVDSSQERLTTLLRAQGYRELAIAHLLGGSIAHAPTLAAKQLVAEQAVEELGHFEVVASIYEEVGGGDLFAAVGARVEDLPVPGSWEEAAVAQLLLDRSGRIDLVALCAAYPRYAEPLRRILVQEEKHEAMSVAMLRECMAANAGALVAAQGHVAKWLPRALASLGESVGLMAAIESLRPTIEACGLAVPAR